MKIALAAVSALLAFDTTLPSLPKLSISGNSAHVPAAAARPRAGWIQGGLLDLTFDRVAWTIRGGALGAPVDIAIDHRAATLKGGAHGRPVDASFDFEPERWAVKGGLLDYVVVWPSGDEPGTIKGGINGRPIDARFSLREGWVRGPGVDLTLEPRSGRLSGGVAGRPIEAVVTNLDLSDVLQHFYLLVK